MLKIIGIEFVQKSDGKTYYLYHLAEACNVDGYKFMTTYYTRELEPFEVGMDVSPILRSFNGQLRVVGLQRKEDK